MNAPNTAPDDTDFDEVRRRVLDTLDRLSAATTEFDLPKSPDALDTCRSRLRENHYTVLVAGEAKRGKSTFVNAILGQNLLPTDVDVATCQVFCIRQADNEAYRLRFEDGSAQEIAASDLPRFGSQVLADNEEAPRLDRTIRWIEVEGPVQFLPKEITLLDTPGLGSLYTGHTRITQRFVPLADAVIFVLHSDSPIGREEIQFLEQITGVMRSVFFIQTMIDRYKQEDWQAVQARNQQVLTEQLGKRLPDVRVWPVSSTNLLKAAETGDVDYELVSKFRPLASALRMFLFGAAGWVRAADALTLALQHQRSAGRVLAQRRDALLEESAVERATRQRGITERRRAFEEKWGSQGQKRRQLLDDVRRMVQISKQGFREFLAPGGKAEGKFRERIDSLKTLDEAQALAGRIGDEIEQEVSARWRQACVKAQYEFTGLLAPFCSAAEAQIIAPPEKDIPSPLLRPGEPSVERDLYTKVQTAAREGIFGLQVTGIAGGIVALLVPAILPAAGVLALGALLYGIVRGTRLASFRELQQAKHQLKEYVREVLQRVQQHYFHVDPDRHRFARVDEFFDGMVVSVTAHVEKIASEKLTESQAEIVRLAEQAKLDEKQRKEKAERLSLQATSWARFETELLALAERMNRLESSCRPSPPASDKTER